MEGKLLDFTKKATPAEITNFKKDLISIIKKNAWLTDAKALKYEGYDPVAFRNALIAAGITLQQVNSMIVYVLMKGSKISKTKGLNLRSKEIRKEIADLGVVDKAADTFEKITLPRVVAAFPLESVLVHAMILNTTDEGLEYRPPVDQIGYANPTPDIKLNAAYFMPGVASALPQVSRYVDQYIAYTKACLKVFNADEKTQTKVTETTTNIARKGLVKGLYSAEEEKALRADINEAMKFNPKSEI